MRYVLQLYFNGRPCYYQNDHPEISSAKDWRYNRDAILYTLPEPTYAMRFEGVAHAWRMGRRLQALYPTIMWFKVEKESAEPPQVTPQVSHDWLAGIHNSLFGNTSRIDHILDWTALASPRNPRNKVRQQRKKRGAVPGKPITPE